MKLKTLDHFYRATNDEFAWRRKEIIDFRLHTRRADSIVQKALLRAGVPLVYAHWEGFIKSITEMLLNFVANQPLTNSDLSDLYFTHSLKSHFSTAFECKKTEILVGAASYLRTADSKAANIKHKNFVNTESNLSSSIFDQIAKSIGVDTTRYLHLYPYIDESIVDRRNKIAHGESLSIGADDFHALVDRASDLLTMYKDDVQNVVATTAYRRET